MTYTDRTQQSQQRVPPLLRTREGRVIAGVAAGVARRLGVQPWLVRVGFVVLALFGGFGIALYLAGWLLIRDEDEPEAVASRLVRRIDGATGWIGVTLVGLAALIFLDSTGLLPGDVAAALVLGVVGVLLYRGELGRGDSPQTPTTPGEGADTDHMTDTSSEEHPMTPTQTPPTFEPERPRSTVTVTPPPTGTEPKPPREPSKLGPLTFAVGFIVLGLIGMFDVLLTEFDPSARHYWSIGLTITGLGLIVGAWLGRARGLIALGVILVPVVVASPLAELDVTGSVGERRIVADSVDEIAAAYELGIGSMVIDLSDVDFDGSRIETTAELGIGELVLLVPDDITVEVDGEAGIGKVQLLGRSSDGVGVDRFETTSGTAGTLIIDASVGIGSLEVRSLPAPADSPDGLVDPASERVASISSQFIGKEAA